MVDTGFTGWLTLPERNIIDLGLTHYGQRRVILANEEQIATEIYSALTLWHGQPRPVLVYQIEGIPLIGMAMLSGSRLIVDAWEDGDVTIEEVPR
jgi:clan AA aspartic protease